MTKIHFSKEELQTIFEETQKIGGPNYYYNFQKTFNSLFCEKAGRKDVTTGYGHCGSNSFPKHTHMPNGYGINYEVYDIVKSDSGFTKSQVDEMGLILPYGHDFHVSFETGVATIHWGTGNISMKMGAGQYTKEGKVIKSLRRIAKDISFSVETEEGEILTYKY